MSPRWLVSVVPSLDLDDEELSFVQRNNIAVSPLHFVRLRISGQIMRIHIHARPRQQAFEEVRRQIFASTLLTSIPAFQSSSTVAVSPPNSPLNSSIQLVS